MASVTYQIAASSDDATETPPGDVFRTGSVEFGTFMGGLYHGGLRFTSVAIPKAASILSATLALHMRTLTTGVRSVIAAHAHDNAPTFESVSYNITSRPLTAASVPWYYDLVHGYTWVSAPDITPVVREIVWRSGWQPGNAIAIIIRGLDSSSTRAWAYSYDIDQALAAKLTVTFEPTAPLDMPTAEGMIIPTRTNAQAAPLDIPTAEGMIIPTRTNAQVAPINVVTAEGLVMPVRTVL